MSGVPKTITSERRHAWKAFYCAWLQVMAVAVRQGTAGEWHEEACAWADDCVAELDKRTPVPPPKAPKLTPYEAYQASR